MFLKRVFGEESRDVEGYFSGQSSLFKWQIVKFKLNI